MQNQHHHANVKGNTVVLTNKRAEDVKPITIKFKTHEETMHFLDVIFNKD